MWNIEPFWPDNLGQIFRATEATSKYSVDVVGVGRLNEENIVEILENHNTIHYRPPKRFSFCWVPQNLDTAVIHCGVLVVERNSITGELSESRMRRPKYLFQTVITKLFVISLTHELHIAFGQHAQLQPIKHNLWRGSRVIWSYFLVSHHCRQPVDIRSIFRTESSFCGWTRRFSIASYR